MKHLLSNLKLMLVALFALVSGSVWADEVTDVLNQSVTGITGTNYTAFDGISVTSDAVYAGQCAGGNSSIQLRSNNSNSGVVTTTSGGSVKKVVVEWNENTAAARVLQVYGSNTAYTAATDLYNTEKQGVLLGELQMGTTELEVDGDYAYIGFRSKSGAMYLTSVSITWETGAAITVGKPTLPASTSFAGSMTVAISAAEGATIHYTLDGTDPTTESAVYSEPLTITETTTVKAIAVVDGTASAVAEATYTALSKSTIAEAQAAETGTQVYVEGTIVASAANGAVLYDGTDYLYYYNTANALTIGQQVRMVGALATYGGAKQLTNAATVTVLGEKEVTHPAVSVLTGAEMDEIVAAKVAERKFVSFVGTLAISGNYFNITVEGAETAVGSIVKPSEDLSELNGKLVKVTGYLMYVNNNKYVYAVATNVAEVATELTNVDFEADDESNAIGIRTYDKDIKGEEVAQAQPVTGWTIVENGNARAAGVFAYGSESFLGGEGYVAPLVNFATDETKALGLIGVWGARIQYTQDVYLTPGTYMLQVPVYNAGGTTSVSSNLIGAAGTYAETKTYPVGQWAVENVEFEITEAQEVTFSLGYNAANSGSGAMPHLFLESAKLFSGEEAITAAKEAAEAQCATANAAIALIKAKADALSHIATLVAGDGLFYYSAEAIEAAQTAVEAAETAEDVATALTTLAAAINAPETGVAYAVANKTANGNLSINAESVTVESKAKVYFTAVEGGYVLSNTEGKYIFKTTNNTWTLSATDNIDEAYVLNVNIVEGGYTLQGANGLLGLDNTAAGSTVYANKAASNNGVWTITEYVEEVTPSEEYTGIKLTFDRTGTSVADVAVKVADQDGNALETVTATLVASSITSFRNAGADALTRTENSVLAPASGAGYSNSQGDQITYTFRIDNLNADFAYNTAVVDVYALNGDGTAQNNNGDTKREWTIGVETGAAEDALAPFVEQEGNDICTVPDTDGGLHHKAWEIAADEAKDATAPLFVKVVLTKTAELGCFAGIGAVELKKAEAEEPDVPEFTYQKYIIQNVASELYWGAANSWGTQASLIPHPEYVKLVPQEDGTYHLESQVNNGGTAYYFNGDYMDNASPVALTIKRIEEPLGYLDDEETIPFYGYTIANGENYYGWDGSTTVLGKNLAADSENAIWAIVSLDDAKAALSDATIDDPIDATFLIEDHDFGRNNRYQNKWTIEASNKNLSGGNNTNNCAESYHSVFTLSQTLADAPAGVYALTAQGFYRQDGEDNDNLPVFYANDETQAFPQKTGSENSMSDASVSFTNGLYTIDPIFVKVEEEGTLTIGAKNEVNTALWCIWDNFVLTYYGADAEINDVKFAALVAQVEELREKAEGLKGTEGISDAAETALNTALSATEDVEKTEEILNGAIETLTDAIEKAQATIAIAPKLAAANRLIASTNVYTAEAKAAYEAIIADAQAKYDDATLTMGEAQTFDNPETIHGWRASNAYDDFLLSAWTFNDVQAEEFSTSLYINTWSTEGENDGSEFKVPFFEYWTDDANSLGEATLTATVTGLQPGGNYDATAWVRVRIKNDAAAPAYGITLDVNGGEAIDVAAGEQVGTSQFYLKEFSATGYADNTGTLKINIKVAADNNISWLSFKNVNYSIGTAISGVDAQQADDAAIYDLTGRRVSKAVKGGIYILNGKKVLVK